VVLKKPTALGVKTVIPQTRGNQKDKGGAWLLKKKSPVKATRDSLTRDEAAFIARNSSNPREGEGSKDIKKIR